MNTAPPDHAQQWLADNWTMAGRFIRDITHDVNNQLGAVLAYAELLALEAPDNAEVRTMVGEISDAVQRASLLIDTVASLPCQDIASVQPVDLCAVLRESLMLFDREIDRRQIRVDKSLPNEPAIVQGVHTRLMRLTIHALRHMFDCAAGSRGGLDVRIQLRGEAEAYALTLQTAGLAEDAHDRLSEASEHAAYHQGRLDVTRDCITVTIPRQTGLT